MSAFEIGDGRGRVLIIQNSLVLLTDYGYQRAAVVYDGLPYPGTPPRWECQAGESRDAFVSRIRAELDREGRADAEIVIDTAGGFWGLDSAA